jgi:hypothetical protein
MQTTGQTDQPAASESLNTLAANINRRLEWWYATGILPPSLAGGSAMWLWREHGWASGALVSFAAFVLTLALWYRAVLRPVSCRQVRRLAPAADLISLASLTNQTQWPHLKHALHICPREQYDSVASGSPAAPVPSERPEK